MVNIKSQAGMTLVEIIIAAALTTLITLIAMTSLLMIGKTAANVDHAADVDLTHYQLSAMLPIYLGQAIEVDWTPSAITNLAAGERGQLLRGYNSDRAQLTGTPIPVPVGLYLRETGRPGTANTGSDIRATALYFLPPTPRTSGKFIISSSGQGTGATVLTPDDPQQVFDYVVEFGIRRTGLVPAGDSAVRMAQVRIVYRKFLDADKNRSRWCPRSQIGSVAACAVVAPFRDIERVVNVLLPNNTVSTNFGGATRRETLFGDLYFFRIGMNP